MNYTNARSVFIHKWGRYSAGEKIAIIYCVILGLLLILTPLIVISPLDGTKQEVYRLLNVHLIKSAVIIFVSWLGLITRSTSFRAKSFIYKTVGFKENEAIFSLFLLLILLTTFIAMGDMASLIKNDITSTMKLSNRYFITTLVMVIGIVYTLRRSIVTAKHISKAPILNSTQSTQELEQEEDMAILRDRLGPKDGLF